MRNILAVLLLAATVSIYASEPKVVTVAAPPIAPAFGREQPCITWQNNNSYWVYQDAGEWQIQNAAVNAQNQIITWSAPKVMNLPKGFLLVGNSNNLPKSRAATVWRATNVGTGKQLWLTAGGHSGNNAWDDVGDAWSTQQPYPWSGSHSGPYQLIPFDSGLAASTPVQMAPVGTDPPAAPEVWLCSHPLAECEVAWSWVTHSGETALSPTLTIPASVNHSTVQGWRRLQLDCYHTGINLPLGALGKYLYTKIDGQWKRQVAKPWLAAETFVDKYLYAVNDMQPIIWSKADGPGHVTPEGGQAWSIVSQEQADLYDGKSVQVKGGMVAYSPIIIPYKPGEPIIGLTSANGGGYKIEQATNVPSLPGYAPPNNHPTYWPLIVVQCADRPSGFRMADATIVEALPMITRGPGFSLVVGSCDTAGGQAFNALFDRCTLRNLTNSWWWAPVSDKWEKEGVAVGVENTYGGHTASEWKFTQCALSSYRQEHIQTVNFVLRDTTLIGYPAPPIKVKHGEAKFYGLVAAKMDSLFEIGFNGRVNCRDLFIDQPSICLMDFVADAPRSSVVRDTSSTCGFDYLVRSPINTRHLVELNFSDWADYRVNPNEPRSAYYHVSPTKLKTLTTNSPLLDKWGQWSVPAIADVMARVPSYQVAP